MSRNRVIQLACIGLAVACLIGFALLSRPINDQREELQLVGKEFQDALPPQIAISRAALGTFKGLAVDMLWYRANRLKDEGKFYEANTLSQAIGQLQPRFTQVWAFNAWNMAYNISVVTKTPEERWDWVRKGIALLRDQGIVYNPKAVKLYKELNWIFFHKIGQFSDDMNWYYKRQFALEWQEVLGTPTEGASTQQVIDSFRRISDAPNPVGPGAIERFVREQPGLADLAAQFESMGYRVDIDLLKRLGRVQMVTYSTDAAIMGIEPERFPDERDRKLAAMLRDTNPEVERPLQALMAFLRKKAIIETYHMDPRVMLEAMERFGPLDWRHASSHAAYWTTLGLEKADDQRNKNDPDFINSYRGNIHALQDLSYRGRIVFDPLTERYDQLPDPRFIPSYEKAFLSTEGDIEKNGWSLGVIDSFEGGYENFLMFATTATYLYGNDADAEGFYKKLRDRYGDKPHNRDGKYLLPLSELVEKQVNGNLETQSYSRQVIDSMITRGFTAGLANNRPDVFEKFLRIAREAHQKWQKYQTPSGKIDPEERMKLMKFEDLVSETFVGFMRSPNAAFLTRARIWRNSPLELRQTTFDRLKSYLFAQAEQEGADPQRAFAEPAGMKEYRELHPLRADEREQAAEGPVRIEKK